MDGLEPVGMRFKERLPTRRVECDALDVAAAPVCTENLIRVDDVTESPKLAE